jgi:hypothetical protein
MRSIQHSFDKLEASRPGLSTYMNFGAAIRGRGFSRGMVRRWFNKLVDKEDYAPEEKRAHLEHMYALAKPLEDNQVRGRKSPQRDRKVETSIQANTHSHEA